MLNTDKLIETVNRFSEKKIGVIGDYAVDHYVFGISRKLSREAPIPIVEVDTEIFTAGCAGNAARNLSCLGAKAVLFGFIGKDFYSTELLKDFSRNKNIITNTLTQLDDYNIPVKMRVFTSQPHTKKQQVARIDRFKASAIKETMWEIVLQKIAENKDSIDAFIISDYNYQLLGNEEFVNKLKKVLSDKTVLVDTHSRFNILRGFTIFTPNEEEAQRILNTTKIDTENIEQTLEAIMKKIECQIIAVTLGKEGMAIKERGRKAIKVPAFLPVEALDTTGAGDTVATTFLLSYVITNDAFTSAVLSQISANIVIQQIGTVACEQSQLLNSIVQYQKYIPLFYQQRN
jgi:rfaE bifunctional protein kinase chain/domain